MKIEMKLKGVKGGWYYSFTTGVFFFFPFSLIGGWHLSSNRSMDLCGGGGGGEGDSHQC